MGWIENYRRREPQNTQATEANPEVRFRQAARERWRQLGQELKTDVAEFNEKHRRASFAEDGDNVYRVRSSESGLELTLRADFDSAVVRYEYEALSKQTAGAPDGGMLSIRQSRLGTAEFYSADERLTSEETRQVLLEPVLFPPQMAA
jgi:hypothetical protein